MVAEQGERVQRIDADTQDIADNVRMGHNELLKYWGRISNDRWLMLKIFGVLIVFVSCTNASAHFHPYLTIITVPPFHSCFMNLLRRRMYTQTHAILMDIIMHMCDSQCHTSRHYPKTWTIKMTDFQPTGMAFTPVPHVFDFLFPRTCFFPPR